MENKIVDLCIVGAGMFGSAAAKYASSNTDIKVCLIGPEEPNKEEWKHRTILGSHYDEGRVMSYEFDETYNHLRQKSVEAFKQLDKDSAVEPLYHETGSLYVRKQNHPDTFKILKFIQDGDKNWLNFSSSNELSNRFPFMRLKDDECAFFHSTSGHISPRKLLAKQKNAATQLGCDIIHDIVSDIQEDTNGMLKVTTQSHGIVEAKKVLVCAGAFTNFIPIFSYKKLNISVNKETYVLIRISEEEAKRIKSMPPMNIFHEKVTAQPYLYGAYVLPPIKYPDGIYYLKIGHQGNIVNPELKTLEEIKDWYHSDGEAYIYEFYTKLLNDTLPDLKIEESISKTCVTCSNPLGYPYIDQVTSSVTVAAVGNGIGVKMCEEVGRIAVSLCLNGKWDSELPRSKFKAIFK